MKFRYVALLVAAVVSLLFNPGWPQVFAQTGKEPTGFRNVRLWIYPEYDDPRLLVMLEGQIVGAEAPVNVRFLVPAEAEMYSAGSKDAQGTYSGGPPQRQASSIPGWDEISYELKTDTFRVEYYDPIILGQPDKKISYDFRWLYPISVLRVVIQQPLKATDFTVTPQGGTPSVEDRLAVLVYNENNLTVGGPLLHFDIAYTKTDPNPSIAQSQAATSSNASDTSQLVGVTVVVGVLLAAGFLWILKSRRRAGPKRKSAAGETGVATKRKGTKNRFCTQCGRPIEGGFQFCPHCGSKRRG